MPASGPMHQLNQGTDDQGPPTPRPDAGRPATGPDRAVPGLLPTTSTDGGTFARLVGRTWPPSGPLPRRVAQPTRPVSQGRRHQPAEARQPRPGSRRRLGARDLTDLGPDHRSATRRDRSLTSQRIYLADSLTLSDRQ